MSNTTDVTLECRGLTKTYYSTDPPAQVLNGIDLSVRSGEFLVIMGASGSGKSTLLYTISGMDRPTSGTVILQGRDLTSLTDAEIGDVRLTQMGFIFQHGYFLANLNIRDYILLPSRKAAPEVRKPRSRESTPCWNVSGSATSSATASPRSRVGSYNAPPSAVSPLNRPCCSSTNRRGR